MARHRLRRRYGHADLAAGRALRSRIAALRIGETLELAPNGYIRKHERATYSLNDRNNKDRNRWGNLEQITEDALFYGENGHLPAPLGPRW